MTYHSILSKPTEDEFINAFPNHDISLLDLSRVEQLRQFLRIIRSCHNETEKYGLCLDKRDELLEKQDGLLGERARLHIEFAFYEPAFAESTTYKATWKRDKKWQKFASDAAVGRKSQARWTAELKAAATQWGEELVQHYAGERGVSFAVEFARTAKAHPDWKSDALPRFQQLVCRRIQLIEKYGRHGFMHALERTDLLNARSWATKDSFIKKNDPDKKSLPFSKLRKEELPYGYVFDQYGLIVPCKTLATAEQDLSTREAREDAINGPSMDITDCANTTNQSSCGVLDAKIDSSQLVDSVTYEPPGHASDTESITANGGIELDRRSDHWLSSGVTDMGDGCSHHTSDSLIPRRSDRILTKSNVAQDIGAILANASSTPSRRDRKRGVRYRGPVENGASCVTAVQVPEPLHVDQLKMLAGRLPALSTHRLDVLAKPPVGLKRKRAASLPPDTSCSYVPEEYGVTVLGSDMHTTLNCISQMVPMSNYGHDDEDFLVQARMEVSKRAEEGSERRGVHTAIHLLPILQNCKHPNTDGNQGPIEIYRLGGQMAKDILGLRTPNVPIITDQQQRFQWKDPSQPIVEFFEWMEDLDRMVSVQIPSLAVDSDSYKRHSLRQVQDRLLSHDGSEDPWNVLDCTCPIPSVLPDFLTSWNCQLLARVREMVLNTDDAERAVMSREDWTQWRDIEHWALLSEGGHCTAPHMDSHGLATWITIQEGLFGFTWMSRPTDKQRTRWMEDPEHYDEGQQWRFLVLRPGQTIFFPSGTIHAVFRVRESKTLALGGHILQWTGVDEWAETISKQAMYPGSTNEDMSDVREWITVVEDLLQKRLQRLGGDAA